MSAWLVLVAAAWAGPAEFDVAGARAPASAASPPARALGPELETADGLPLPELPRGPPPRPLTTADGLPLPAWPVRPSRRRVWVLVGGAVLAGASAGVVVGLGPALDP